MAIYKNLNEKRKAQMQRKQEWEKERNAAYRMFEEDLLRQERKEGQAALRRNG